VRSSAASRYCSTFDSTPRRQHRPGGRRAARVRCTAPAVPAAPSSARSQRTGRTLIKGHLFAGAQCAVVGERPDAPAPAHADDRRQPGARDAGADQHRVGLVPHEVVAQGSAAIAARFAQLQAQGVGVAVVDAVSNEDLVQRIRAMFDLRSVTYCSS